MNLPQVVSFAVIVQDALDFVRGCLEERGLTVAVAAGLPEIYGDRMRLVTVIQNLVDNAVKYMGDQPAPPHSNWSAPFSHPGRDRLFCER